MSVPASEDAPLPARPGAHGVIAPASRRRRRPARRCRRPASEVPAVAGAASAEPASSMKVSMPAVADRRRGAIAHRQPLVPCAVLNPAAESATGEQQATRPRPHLTRRRSVRGRGAAAASEVPAIAEAASTQPASSMTTSVPAVVARRREAGAHRQPLPPRIELGPAAGRTTGVLPARPPRPRLASHRSARGQEAVAVHSAPAPAFAPPRDQVAPGKIVSPRDCTAKLTTMANEVAKATIVPSDSRRRTVSVAEAARDTPPSRAAAGTPSHSGGLRQSGLRQQRHRGAEAAATPAARVAAQSRDEVAATRVPKPGWAAPAAGQTCAAPGLKVAHLNSPVRSWPCRSRHRRHAPLRPSAARAYQKGRWA